MSPAILALIVIAALAVPTIVILNWPKPKPPERPILCLGAYEVIDRVNACREVDGVRTLVLTLREGDRAWIPRIDSQTFRNLTRGPCRVTYRWRDRGGHWQVHVKRPGVSEEEEAAGVKEASRRNKWIRDNKHLLHLYR